MHRSPCELINTYIHTYIQLQPTMHLSIYDKRTLGGIPLPAPEQGPGRGKDRFQRYRHTRRLSKEVHEGHTQLTAHRASRPPQSSARGFPAVRGSQMQLPSAACIHHAWPYRLQGADRRPQAHSMRGRCRM